MFFGTLFEVPIFQTASSCEAISLYILEFVLVFLVVFLLFSLQSFLYGEINYLNKKGMTVETRYSVPKGYKRVSVEKGSFAEFLRNQKLKP